MSLVVVVVVMVFAWRNLFLTLGCCRYANGKVCLSLLGTWRGGGASEEWNDKSTLMQVRWWWWFPRACAGGVGCKRALAVVQWWCVLQVLVSILGLIFVEVRTCTFCRVVPVMSRVRSLT